MNTLCNFALALLIYSNAISVTVQDAICGDWIAYKDEKCIKLFEPLGTQTHDEGIETCRAHNSSTLASIKSKEEQVFIQHYVFVTLETVDNVWIGAHRNVSNNQTFYWESGIEWIYNNWEDGNNVQVSGSDCVQLQTGVGNAANVGKWTVVPCKKKNLVLCEFRQSWSLSRMQSLFVDFRQEIRDFVTNSNSNLVPIGFIYVQLPNQTEPKTLWPTVSWEEISSSYAGLFFRVAGGNAAPFGQIQNENSTRIVTVESLKDALVAQNLNIDTSANGWSNWVYTGGSSGSNYFLRFLSSGGEVRPRNQAIRIWRRSA